jgi:hypothetical protein
VGVKQKSPKDKKIKTLHCVLYVCWRGRNQRFFFIFFDVTPFFFFFFRLLLFVFSESTFSSWNEMNRNTNLLQFIYYWCLLVGEWVSVFNFYYWLILKQTSSASAFLWRFRLSGVLPYHKRRFSSSSLIKQNITNVIIQV